jgi:hypothetical protein
VSRPISLHTADRLERALYAQLQCVAARGAKGWVMRIVAYFACQYARAVIELLEGLLAEYRAGTLVLPAMVDDSSTPPADCGTAKQGTKPARPSGVAVRGLRPPGNTHANRSREAPSEAREACAARYAAIAPCRPAFVRSAPRRPIRRPNAAPRHLAGHPPAVPRARLKNSGAGGCFLAMSN